MRLTVLARYFHTLRHLRPVQFYGRLWFRLYRPRPDSRPAPPPRPGAGPWISPPAGEPRLLGPATFRFLNQTHTLADPGDWNAPGTDQLWLYNLHYFDDLNAAGAADRRDWQRALIARWIAENPPGRGNGWEPYPPCRCASSTGSSGRGRAIPWNRPGSIAWRSRFVTSPKAHERYAGSERGRQRFVGL